MANEKSDVQIQAKLFTKLDTYTIPDTLLSIPIVSRGKELNSLLKGLLADKKDIETIEFDFLINGEYFQSPDIAQYVKDKNISTESVLEIEYIFQNEAPKFDQSLLHNDWVSSIDLKGNLILTGTYDNLVNVWDTSGELILSLKGHTMAVKCVTFAPSLSVDKVTCLSGSQDQSVLMWSYNSSDNTSTCVHMCRGHGGSVDAITAHPTENKFASGSWDKMIKIWDSNLDFEASNEVDDEGVSKKLKNILKGPTTRTPLVTLSGHKEAVSSLLWMDKSQLVSASWDHCIRLWDAEACINTSTLTGNKVHLDISYSPYSKLLATASTDKHIRLWDPLVSSGAVVKTLLSSHTGWVSSVEWSPSNQHQLVSGSYDNTTKIWDIRSTKEALIDLQPHMDKVMCVCWAQDTLILSGGVDCMLNINSSTLQESPSE